MRTYTRYLLFLVACGLAPLSARADDPPPGLETVTFHGQNYFIRTVDPRKDDLRLFWNDDQGGLLRDFTALDKFVRSKGEHLVFATNAGMFEPDSKPVGLLVQNGVTQSPLNLNDGTGNFSLKPNGVFLINQKHEAHIVESSEYMMLLTPAVWATQSGPLLVHGGDIHPDFIEGSKNKNIRSGVGVTKNGMVFFAISRNPVNFYDFAALFDVKLQCPNALYLDGVISAFSVPGIKDPMPHSFGPMFGLVEKDKSP